MLDTKYASCRCLSPWYILGQTTSQALHNEELNLISVSIFVSLDFIHHLTE